MSAISTTFNGLAASKLEYDSMSVTVTEFGSHVVSWTVNDVEMIFMSKSSKFDKSKALRGGIPIVFPQFREPLQSMNQHGFARNKEWKLINTSDNKDNKLMFELLSDESTLEQWPHEFKLIYTISLEKPTNLVLDLKVENIGNKSFQCHTLLHTYFRLNDSSETIIGGFDNMMYKSNIDNKEYKNETTTNRINQEIDRIYSNFYNKEEDEKFVSIYPDAGLRSMKIYAEASLTPNNNKVPVDVVFWNAWIDRCKAMGDLDDDAYKHYVCIEPGTIEWVTVEAGESLQLTKRMVYS